MSEVAQGHKCRSCHEMITFDNLVVIRENDLEGRVHIRTCLNCIKRLNHLEDK